MDETKFKTTAECDLFVVEHRARVEDWYRGRLNLPWKTKVFVTAECKLEEKEA